MQRNLFLQTLPPEARASLEPYLEQVQLPARTMLLDAGETPRHVHFLTSGVASMVAAMEDGEVVEVGLFGPEGLPEYLHLLGPQTGATHCVMQLAGTAYRMRFDRFQSMLDQVPQITPVIHRLVQHQALVLAQIGACNRLHSVSSRLARWLLMVCDRVQEPQFSLTQEGLAAMIGSRRATINTAVGALQELGPIELTRGKIVIKDSKLLQQSACECYPIIRELYNKLYR